MKKIKFFSLAAALATLFTANSFAQDKDTAYVPFSVNVNATATAKLNGVEKATASLDKDKTDTLYIIVDAENISLARQGKVQSPAMHFHRGKISLELARAFGSTDIALYSLNGKQIMRGKAAASAASISHHDVKAGVYLLSVKGAGGNAFATRLAHSGGGLNIDVAFLNGNAGSVLERTIAGSWTITVSAPGYLDTSYAFVPETGVAGTPVQNITLLPVPGAGGDRWVKFNISNLTIDGSDDLDLRIYAYADAALTQFLGGNQIPSGPAGNPTIEAKGTPGNNIIYAVVLAKKVMGDPTWAAKSFQVNLGTAAAGEDMFAPKEVSVDFGAVTLKTVHASYTYSINGTVPISTVGSDRYVSFWFELPGVNEDNGEPFAFDLASSSEVNGDDITVADLATFPFPIYYAAFGHENGGQQQGVRKVFTSGGINISDSPWIVEIDEIAKKITGSAILSEAGITDAIQADQSTVTVITTSGVVLSKDKIYNNALNYNNFETDGFKMLVPSADADRSVFIMLVCKADGSGDEIIRYTKPFTIIGGIVEQAVNLEWDLTRLPPKVTFKVNGGTWDGTATADEEKSVNSSNVISSMPGDPVRAGYTFAGWNTQADGSGAGFNQAAALYIDLTLFAQWTPDPLTITYNANGGLIGGVASKEEDGFTGGTAVNPGDPTWPTNPIGLFKDADLPADVENWPEFWQMGGKTFDYWYKDDEGTPWDFDTELAGNTTLLAKWTAVTGGLEPLASTVAGAIGYVNANSAGGPYTLLFGADFPYPGSLPPMLTGGSLTLKGIGGMRTITPGYIQIRGGTLTLDNNITMLTSQIFVNDYTTTTTSSITTNSSFIMKEGSVLAHGNPTSPESPSTSSGVEINYRGTFTMDGGTITGWGRAVAFKSASSTNAQNITTWYSGTFIMHGGTITGNNRNGDGGGVWMGAGTFTMNGGTISGNTATGDGGGVYLQKGSSYDLTFTKTGGTIYGSGEGANSNTAAGGGQAVYYYTTTVTRYRNTTAGPDVNLSSGSATNWGE